ncbi:bifunctional nuclease family protein [candidate division WOR-3 bacterium]|uniref:Bifunctional nuclease family protein n=1 Tax=candidate division WOR-3 bacterium TaxID=2052148 RepID=A0A9D5K747_UNCW3|nr:bifunctional nuclease family protein [candidate division WOR-3 bacterium]MBD3363586.1 bifunctional nuclease family protein [candidate division WOR-3 bacterium]
MKHLASLRRGIDVIEVEVQGVSFDLNNAPVLLLKERGGRRLLPIWVGPIEASAITYAARRESFERPLTLDIIKRIIEALGSKVERIIITGLKENTYYASLVLSRDDEVISIDARPSDSVAIAVHMRAPIFVDSELMEEQSREMAEDEEAKLDELKERLRDIDPENFGNFKL